MLITQEQAKALRRKKADLQLKNYEFASEIGVAPRTVPKILNGDYKAPKRIYASLMEWLAKDYWKQQKKAHSYQLTSLLPLTKTNTQSRQAVYRF